MTKFTKKTKFSLEDAITSSKFDFCKNLKWFLIVPVAIILVGIILLSTVGFNLGIDFTGGTNMTIFIDKDGSYTTSKTYDVNRDLDKIQDVVNGVLKEYGLKASSLQSTSMSEKSLGILKADAVIVKYQNGKYSEEEIAKNNDEIQLKLLQAFGYVSEEIQTPEELENVEYAKLVQNGGVTTASATAELMMKSFIALLVAVVLILIYVAFRFELTSGLAAILALFHDVLVTAAVMLICRVQINVSFIAALITILGYSINNTIIIFDKMREEIKTRNQAGEKFKNNDVANLAVKQSMMRSLLTALTTLIMVLMITIIGVADIREFAFPILVGIVAGFYSSNFLTPGLWAIAYRGKRKKKTTFKKPENMVGAEPNE